jgi:threonine/homoserine/homoserine lactone efflux protein
MVRLALKDNIMIDFSTLPLFLGATALPLLTLEFVAPGMAPVALQFLVYGAVIAGVGFGYDAVLALLCGGVGGMLLERPPFQRCANWVMASVYLALAPLLLLMRS